MNNVMLIELDEMAMNRFGEFGFETCTEDEKMDLLNDYINNK